MSKETSNRSDWIPILLILEPAEDNDDCYDNGYDAFLFVGFALNLVKASLPDLVESRKKVFSQIKQINKTGKHK